MGRKNKRKKNCYSRKLHINTKKIIRQEQKPVYENPIYKGDQTEWGYENQWDKETMQLQIPKHGEIWFAQLGKHPGTSVQDGCRPVLIMSNNSANMYSSTITVIPMTSKNKRPDMATHIWLTDVSEEIGEGMLLVEQITTISKSALRRCVGTVNQAEQIAEIEKAICTQLGFRTESNSIEDIKEKGVEAVWQVKEHQ